MSIDIVYSSDDKYVRHLYVSLSSLLESNKEVEELNIYIIDNKISEANRQLLKKLVGDNQRNLRFLSFKEIEDSLDGVSLWGGSLSTYARLFLAHYLAVDKVLYLDADSVIIDNLSPLFELDLNEYYFAAVQDVVGPVYRKQVGIIGSEKYINSGLILINLKKWREDNIEKRFLEFIKMFNGNVPCCDQGTLNGVCKGKILFLPPKYNLMTPMLTFNAYEIKKFYEIPEYYSQEALDEARAHPIFIHYVGGFYVRPWFENSDHPKMVEYRKYMNRSPWKDQYLSNENLGARTKSMKFAYKILPFPCFIGVYRLIRGCKRILHRA